jgi:hypothetical protein
MSSVWGGRPRSWRKLSAVNPPGGGNTQSGSGSTLMRPAYAAVIPLAPVMRTTRLRGDGEAARPRKLEPEQLAAGAEEVVADRIATPVVGAQPYEQQPAPAIGVDGPRYGPAAALVVFAAACGVFALVGVLLSLLKLAADTAGAIAAAGLGATISIPLARRKR